MFVAGLARAGWVVDAVTDGAEALARALHCCPAAIVTDACVPRLDGLQLCRLLKNDRDARHIPVLVMMSKAEERHIAAALEAGADRVLLKPCLPDQLARAIEAILNTARDKQFPRVVTIDAAASTSMSALRAQSKLHHRSETTTPPWHPPQLFCPQCDRPLAYHRSHVGGVSAKHHEQWDYYDCPSGCGQFQYRQRTRKLRDVS